MLVREQREFEAAIAVWVSTNPPVSVHLFNRWTDNLQLYWLYFESTWVFGWCLLDLLSLDRAYIFLGLLLLLWIKGNIFFFAISMGLKLSRSLWWYLAFFPNRLLLHRTYWAPKNLKAQTLDYDCDKSRIQKLLSINIRFIPERKQHNSTTHNPRMVR